MFGRRRRREHVVRRVAVLTFRVVAGPLSRHAPLPRHAGVRRNPANGSREGRRHAVALAATFVDRRVRHTGAANGGGECVRAVLYAMCACVRACVKVARGGVCLCRGAYNERRTSAGCDYEYVCKCTRENSEYVRRTLYVYSCLHCTSYSVCKPYIVGHGCVYKILSDTGVSMWVMNNCVN